jgi:hypothetical protein
VPSSSADPDGGGDEITAIVVIVLESLAAVALSHPPAVIDFALGEFKPFRLWS